jgi:hypothetical protein
MKLGFNNKEDAISFAEQNGWKFEVAPPLTPQCYPSAERNYSQNFLNPRVEEVVKAAGVKSTEFSNPKYGDSGWFMPLTYHGDGLVAQHGPAAPAAGPAAAAAAAAKAAPATEAAGGSKKK